MTAFSILGIIAAAIIVSCLFYGFTVDAFDSSNYESNSFPWKIWCVLLAQTIFYSGLFYRLANYVES